MNILFLSQIVPWPPHGGVLQRGFNIVREISRFGKVHLVAYVHPDVFHPPFSEEEGRRVLGEICATLDFVELWPKRSPLNKYAALSLGYISGQPFSVIAHRSQVFRDIMRSMIEKEDIDLIHYDTIALSQFFMEGTDIPKVMTHHNIESNLMERRATQESSPLTRHYVGREAAKLKRYEKSECPRYDMNITVSEEDAALLKKMSPGLQTRVVPNGVDVEYFKPFPTAEKDRPSLIYTGGMNMFANKDAVLYFLDVVWPLIRKEVPDVRFFAVGQNPPKELLDLADGEPDIKVTGFVDDVRPYINDASVYVVPLRVGGGTRLKILDAMAMGKAIVSTSMGCEGIETTDGVNIQVADEPEAFAQHTIRLLRDREMRERMGLEARDLVKEKYSWNSIGESLRCIYEEVIAGKKAAP